MSTSYNLMAPRFPFARPRLFRATFVLLAASACDASSPTVPDPAQPYPDHIVAANGTTLHSIDYGGRGTAVVFLAGLGNSAHVFDDFAPRLTNVAHVYAFTRRGFGKSGRPTSGFDTRTLASDVLALFDSLGIERAVLVGHSLGGDELTEVAASAPGRVLGLAYVDAAYDRSDGLARLLAAEAAGALPPSPPAPSVAQQASASAYREYLAWTRGFRLPLREVRATFRFDDSGRLVGPATEPETFLMTIASVTEPRILEVRAPIIAIYATARTVPLEFPWIRTVTGSRAALEAQAQRSLDFQQTWEAEQRTLVRRLLPGARVVEVPGASHYVFLSDASLVERELRSFIAGVRVNGLQSPPG